VLCITREPGWPYCSRVDDLQRPPTDRDRDQVVARINRAHDDGRISTADRDIRLGNVRSAQSMSELDLMSRDLDQLEAALPAAAPASQPYGAFDPRSRPGSEPPPGARRTVLALSLVIALVLIGVAALFVVGYRVARSSDDDPSVSPGAPTGATEEPATPAADPSPAAPAGPSYSLSAGGIRSFLASYEKKFHTTRVVDLTLYGDYVIVNVPVPGHARQAGWLYRQGAWTTFGGVRATFPGSEVVDTTQLDVPALVRNIARARRTLKVEQPQAYVIVRYLKGLDQAPSVDIHVTNKFQESGYLATTLDGKIERAYPYDR
jgi:hypothetical protein